MPTAVPTKMASTTPKTTGRPTARVVSPASTAKMVTASRIDRSFLRVDMEIGTNTDAIRCYSDLGSPIGKSSSRLDSGRALLFWQYGCKSEPRVVASLDLVSRCPDARHDKGRLR